MPAFYTIVQYVPDPVADERINVGVIVFSDGRVQSRFLRNWDRVRRFAQGDIAHVRDFAGWISSAAVPSQSGHLPAELPGVQRLGIPGEDDIRRIAAEWSNAIQLTSPQPSLEDPDILLNRLAHSYLREPLKRRRQEFHDKQDVARLAFNTVRGAVARQLGTTEAYRVVHHDFPVGGRVIPNVKVDVAVTNSTIHAVSQALSFETHDMAELDRQKQNALYTLKDIAEARESIRRDIVVLPPIDGQPNYREALEHYRALPSLCRQVGAGVVPPPMVEAWADELASLIGRDVQQNRLHSQYA